MKWPFVFRGRFDAFTVNVQAEQRAWQSMRGQMATEIARLKGELTDARDQTGLLRQLCNRLEGKQRDIDNPPISSDDLRDNLRRLSELQSECAALHEVNRALEKRLAEVRNGAVTATHVGPPVPTVIKPHPFGNGL